MTSACQVVYNILNYVMPPHALNHRVSRHLSHIAISQWLIILMFALAMLAMAHNINEPLNIIIDQMFEAWFSAGIFVFVTLAAIYACERLFRFDLGNLLAARGHKRQIILASLLGAIPGCGGAIVVVLQFIKQKTSFASLVAALTTTMGDTAFLLLARAPYDAIVIILVQVSAGFLSGWCVHHIHGRSFLIPGPQATIPGTQKITSTVKNTDDHSHTESKHPFLRLAVPGFWIAVVVPSQVIVSSAIIKGTPLLAHNAPFWVFVLGITGTALCLLSWIISPDHNHMEEPENTNIRNKTPIITVFIRLIHETSYVTAWVFIAYCIFGGLVYAGLNVSGLFRTWTPLLPMMAILVGFIPGCGPQLLVATLYLSRLLPFSAQLGNAISTDGDALFPALSVVPKAALIATLYSSVPAFIIAYLTYFLFE